VLINALGVLRFALWRTSVANEPEMVQATFRASAWTFHNPCHGKNPVKSTSFKFGGKQRRRHGPTGVFSPFKISSKFKGLFRRRAPTDFRGANAMGAYFEAGRSPIRYSGVALMRQG
jgi:hypothetical protein